MKINYLFKNEKKKSFDMFLNNEFINIPLKIVLFYMNELTTALE